MSQLTYGDADDGHDYDYDHGHDHEHVHEHVNAHGYVNAHGHVLTTGHWPLAMKLLIATSNVGKVREIEAALAGLPIEVAKLGDLRLPGLEESGLTFTENARQKALHYARLSGLVTLADDSGLEVDLLDGRPGVLSSRYGRDDGERIARLLAELRSSRQSPVAGEALSFLSSARFVCAVCVAGDAVFFTTEGRCEGSILDHPVPGGGFGYDPVFYSIEAGAPLSRLSVAEKNAVSHRGKAMAEVRRWFRGQDSGVRGQGGD